MLSFKELAAGDFQDVHEKLLSFEQEFPPQLRMAEAQYRKIFDTEGGVAIAAIVDGQYAGFAIGDPMSAADVDEMQLQGLDLPAVYLANFVASGEHRGKGFGTLLLEEFLRVATGKGYKKMVGHFRHNASLRVAEKLGGKKVRVHEDWCGSREPVTLCVFDLGAAE